MPSSLPIAIYYEHPDWFRPLFAAFDKRGTPYVKLDARRHFYDPAQTGCEYGVLFNRMSPSAYLRSDHPGIFYTLGYLAHLERLGTRVVNGRQAFTTETSKALQLTILQGLGLPYPKARVIGDPLAAPAAAEGLRFPVVVKANIGGSGAGVVRYDSLAELEQAAHAGTIDLGIDKTALVQEFVPARDGRITRVETLGGKYLYAIHVYTSGDSFNLCPADICQTTDGVELARAAREGTIDLGIDKTALVQEFVPARDGRITRVETLGGKYLYAIHVYTPGDSFNLCPADICQTTDGVELARGAAPADAPKNRMSVEGYTPPPEVISAVERIMAASGIDVGGIEYMIDDRDGTLVYYDINALSNFVADAPRVVGFDPFARLADYLEKSCLQVS